MHVTCMHACKCAAGCYAVMPASQMENGASAGGSEGLFSRRALRVACSMVSSTLCAGWPLQVTPALHTACSFGCSLRRQKEETLNLPIPYVQSLHPTRN